ncbi:hypothetical protein [uncultured Flavobacterium sp.]|jgi:hypothetical protein|uniref:hypothetical protein n=1 Tax=uncultured Flavobacterium sp. TaxID=165435 RepID=UPI002595FFA1|nr:hypothetical protein [uncultured Flavobacterium sp.]
MIQKKYNKTNFHKHTFCEFREVTFDEISDVIIHHKSKSGSSYSFNDEGVYRISNHWGRAANCRWRLISRASSNSNSKINNNQSRIGFAKWVDFYPNNDTEKLFYIEVDFESNDVIFQHKNNPNFDGKSIVRNASETAKVIRQIKEILETTTWASYYEIENIQLTRKKIIESLLKTNLSLAEIKRNILS